MFKQFQTLFEQLQKLAQELAHEDGISKIYADGQLTSLQRHIFGELLQGYPSQPPTLTDELTGLLVRSSLIDRLNHLLINPIAPDSILAVCFIDLDGFKAINDQHGHAVGDQALSLVCERIQNSIRSGDLLGRWGGDEFVLVLQNVDCQKSVEHLADRLLSAISYPLKLSANEPLTLFLGASIGVAITTSGVLNKGVDALVLIEKADQAMYLAKRAGKNRIEIVA